jgi:hypothetical protein
MTSNTHAWIYFILVFLFFLFCFIADQITNENINNLKKKKIIQILFFPFNLFNLFLDKLFFLYFDITKKYVGEKKNGIPHGLGEMKWRNGDYYEGRFKNGKKHGKGLYISIDKQIEYDGEFKDDKFHGKGTFTTKDGKKRIVIFKKGELLE